MEYPARGDCDKRTRDRDTRPRQKWPSKMAHESINCKYSWDDAVPQHMNINNT